MATPTTDQLRDQIDRGQTGEKIAMPDPAVAPLGTDAEAGGHPPSAAETTLASRTAPRARLQNDQPGLPVYLGLILAVATIALIVLLAALRA